MIAWINVDWLLFSVHADDQFHLDLLSLLFTNRKSYLGVDVAGNGPASDKPALPLLCCSGDQRCPKTFLTPTNFGTAYSAACFDSAKLDRGSSCTLRCGCYRHLGLVVCVGQGQWAGRLLAGVHCASLSPWQPTSAPVEWLLPASGSCCRLLLLIRCH